MKTVSFFKYVNKTLNPYRVLVSLSISVFASLTFAVFSFKKSIDTDRQLIESLSPYLSTLVESSDRPELLRIISSIAKTRNSEIIITQGKNVFATSRNLEELDQPFSPKEIKFHLSGIGFNFSEIIYSTEIKRLDSLKLDSFAYIISPLSGYFYSTVGIFLAVLIISSLISFYLEVQMRKAIKKALTPLNQLHIEIKGLIEENIEKNNPIQIRELEEIRNTITKTKIDLENAKDKLSEAKAKKLALESYKKLIHDLHNPVAALRQMSKMANSESVDSATRGEASSSIPRIADQILAQVKSAKRNLEEEPVALRELNILDCVQDSIQQIKMLNPDKKIIQDFSVDSLIVAHDPSLLKRAIINLIENGIEAAGSKVKVSVTQSYDQAHISICDDGPGMDEESIPIYLQGRGQSNKANRQAFGLSSTNHIVRSHGGKLIYRRSDLGGSSFEIRLGAN